MPLTLPTQDQFLQYVSSLNAAFAKASAGNVVFVPKVGTNIGSKLFRSYLHHIPRSDKQYHNCTECRQFFKSSGAAVLSTGISLFHAASKPGIQNTPAASGYYADSVYLCQRKIETTFAKNYATEWTLLSCEDNLGTPGVDGDGWSHWNLVEGVSSAVLPATRAEANAVMDRALPYLEYIMAIGPDLLRKAIVKARTIRGSVAGLPNKDAALHSLDDYLCVVTELQQYPRIVNPESLAAVCKMLITNPARRGYPGSLMATFVEEIVSYGESSAIDNYRKRARGTSYMRPTSAVSDNQIEQSHKAIRDLGIDPNAFSRRAATLSDVLSYIPEHALWFSQESSDQPADSSGPFSGISASRRKGNSCNRGPRVAPGHIKSVSELSVRLKYLGRHIRQASVLISPKMSFFTLTTGDSRSCILKWDSPAERNPISWYYRAGGSRSSEYGLSSGGYARVSAIITTPNAWNCSKLETEAPHGLPNRLMFIIEGAHDQSIQEGMSSLGLFPQVLINDLHKHRKVIEALNSSGHLPVDGYQNSACGVVAEPSAPVTLCLTAHDGSDTYLVIDRVE